MQPSYKLEVLRFFTRSTHTHTLVTHTHTTLSHRHTHTQLLLHTQLSLKCAVTPNSFTRNFARHAHTALSRATFSHATLSHTYISHATLSQTHNFYIIDGVSAGGCGAYCAGLAQSRNWLGWSVGCGSAVFLHGRCGAL